MQIQPISIQHNGYTITSDKALLQVPAIHKWLSEESYWAKGIPEELVQQTVQNSFAVGILKDDEQVGFARVITDYATFGYLADVYITEPHRGQGLSKALMQFIMQQEWVKGLRRMMLATRDAHTLYEQFGFTAIAKPERLMEILLSNPYLPESQTPNT